jgi:hypothetical protein
MLLQKLQEIRALAGDAKYRDFPPMQKILGWVLEAIDLAKTTPGTQARRAFIVLEAPGALSPEERDALQREVTGKMDRCRIPHELLILDAGMQLFEVGDVQAVGSGEAETSNSDTAAS